ncbi:MAG TPA: acetate uptake transporter [Chitinophagaceae bacterium]|nr:acetate uptake transporter [Chitinophagaceae bacterium]
MTPASEIIIKDQTANPAALGLFGFGMTTVLLNLGNAGLIPMDSMILAMGICYGGITQVIAGIMESRKNNSFGFTAFLSFGFFWLSLVVLLVLPKMGWATAASHSSMGAYFVLWGVFTGILWIGTFRISLALQVVFVTLLILFTLLAIHEFTSNPLVGKAAGVEGILCGASAIYTGAANLLNEIYGRTVLPVGLVVRSRSDLTTHD